MFNRIQYFQEKGIQKLQKVFDEYSHDFSKMAEMVYGVTEEITKLGCSMIAEEWESYDEILRERKDIRKGWYIVRKDASISGSVMSKETVMNKLHALNFPKVLHDGSKKVVETL